MTTASDGNGTGKPAATPPAKGTPEYNKMMAESYENQGGDSNSQSFSQNQGKPVRPENVPEKFWDAETGAIRTAALLQSYAELERARSQPKPTAQTPAPGSTQVPDQATAADAVANAGLDWDTISNKVSQTGALEEADYQALEKAGVPKHIVDGYIHNTKIATALARQKSAEVVGGEKVLDAILAKAAQTLSPSERDGFNKLLAGENTHRDALMTLKNRFAPSDGEPESQLNGNQGSPGSAVGFSSAFEQNEAVNKKDDKGRRLYDIDPAYRNQVRQRMLLTK